LGLPDFRKYGQMRLTVLSQRRFSCKRNFLRRVSPRIGAVLQTLRNIAIIAALAAGIDFLPGGGAAAATVLSALMMIFFAAIAWLVYRVYREQQLTLTTLTDGRKAGLFGAVGAIALLVVGYDEFASWTGGVLLWIALMAGCVGVIFLVWRSATTYS
jgi:O-antigen/teichoic acid export membrane protein